MVAARPEWGVNLVDLRLHGQSRGFEPPHVLASCVHDLIVLANELDVSPDAILGHSFGGKVALMAAPALRPRQVWVIDSTPSRRTPGGGAVRMLQILRRLPTHFASRSEAVAALEAEGVAAPVAHWMATNVELDGERFVWRIDPDDMQSLLDDFFRRDLWDVVERPPAGTEIHMVRASESDVLPAHELARLRAVASDAVHGYEIHGGHWLHEDNPAGLLDLLVERLPGA
jgi:pimeloyl-ACP methyl ester carboxylesterase